jgi:hypothetical protein
MNWWNLVPIVPPPLPTASEHDRRTYSEVRDWMNRAAREMDGLKSETDRLRDAGDAMRRCADEIERLRDVLATARREERERCAAVCDAIEIDLWHRYKHGEGYDRGNPHNSAASDGATQCAAAIRALTDEEGPRS